jgi:hypothetical protein
MTARISYSFKGEYFAVDGLTMLPRPAQIPRIPVWAVGVWGKPKSVRRALAWDGIIPQRYRDWNPFSPEEYQMIRDEILRQRGGEGCDIVAGGVSGGGAKAVRPFAEAGATWWVEGDMGTLFFEKVRGRLRQGPPV